MNLRSFYRKLLNLDVQKVRLTLIYYMDSHFNRSGFIISDLKGK